MRCIEREWGRAFERLGVALVAVRVFEENAIAAADSHLAVTLGIESEADPRRRVEEMPLDAAGVRTGASGGIGESIHREGPACAAALDDAVKRIAGTWLKRARECSDRTVGIDDGRVGGSEGIRIKIKSMSVPLSVSSVEAEPETKVEGQAFGDSPVVLEIGLNNSVAVVILGLEIPLLVLRDVSQQQVSEGVSRADRRIAGIECEDALQVRRALLVFLSKHQIGSKRHRMVTENFG